jgi:hypothetical protein
MWREPEMKILVFAKRHDGVQLEEMQPYFTAEIQAVWDLYAKGVCRGFYARADQGGPAILEVEAESVETARQTVETLPLVERHLLDLEYVPLAPFTNLSRLFQSAN